MSNIKLFQSKQIRSVWNEEEQQWYFSVIDVVGALTDSIYPSAYWIKLKQCLILEENEPVTNCHRLKMQAADGKMRLTKMILFNSNDTNLILLFSFYKNTLPHFIKNSLFIKTPYLIL